MIRRGQISIEYLIIVGFVTFLVIGIMGVAFFYASSTRDRIRTNQLITFADKVISSAESVYYSGEPSKVTIVAYLPKGVTSIGIEENSLVVSIVTSSGISTMSFSSNVPISGSISVNEGVKNVEVVAEENGAVFREV